MRGFYNCSRRCRRLRFTTRERRFGLIGCNFANDPRQYKPEAMPPPVAVSPADAVSVAAPRVGAAGIRRARAWQNAGSGGTIENCDAIPTNESSQPAWHRFLFGEDQFYGVPGCTVRFPTDAEMPQICELGQLECLDLGVGVTDAGLHLRQLTEIRWLIFLSALR